jgi:predicted cupin superfamily sugar epimerase
MTAPTARDLIQRLHLTRHPEGGWFRETYRSTESIPAGSLPQRFPGERSFATAIFFLLEKSDISALHRIRSDEVWHFYAGTALTVQMITPEGVCRSFTLGADIAAGELYQAVVPAGCWFGAEVTGEGPFSLVGCTVAPGFDFQDFEMGDRDRLLTAFPGQADLIRRLATQAPRPLP